MRRNTELKTKLEAVRKQGTQGEVMRPLIDAIRALDSEPARSHRLWEVLLVAPNQTHAQRFASVLRGYGLSVEEALGGELSSSSSRAVPALEERDSGESDFESAERTETVVRVVAGELSEGFCSPEDGLLVLSESELFGTASRKASKRRRKFTGASLAQLEVGDYVVHLIHGVAAIKG